MMLRGNQSRAGSALALTAGLGVLGGCAMKPVAVSSVLPPATVALNPPAPLPPRPVAPAGIPASFSPPPRLPNGSYLTINSNLSSPEYVWHLRSALNVAALGCRDPGAATMIADYNILLNQQTAALKAAYDAARLKYKASFGKGWEDQFDSNSTRVYNFFSQPIAHTDFCIAAEAVAEQIKTVAGPALDTFAAAVLPRLERPFIDVYAQVDSYKIEIAAWNARYAQASAAGLVPVVASQSSAYGLSGPPAPAASAAPLAAPAKPTLPYEQVGAVASLTPRS